MGTLLTLAKKDLTLLFRDKFALFWIFAFPLIYAVFFGSLFGGDDGGVRAKMRIAVVDDDRSEESRALLSRLAAHESVAIETTGEGDDAEPRAHEIDAARRAVRLGKKVAYLRIPKDYFESPFAMFGGGGGDRDRPELEVGIDPSRKAEAGFLQGVLMETVFRGMGDLFTDKEKMKAEIDRARAEIASGDGLNTVQKAVLQTFMGALSTFFDSVDLEVLESGPASGFGGGAGGGRQLKVVEVARDRSNRPKTAFDITFPSAIVWGLMGVATGFGVTLVRERAQGTLLRLRAAPIGRAQLLAGKALGCFVMCMIVMLFLLGFATVALGVRVDDILLLLVAMVSTGACFTGVMMLVSVMGKTEEAVAGASWGVMMPFAMIGGGMIPLVAMPSWLLTVSNVSPFKWGIYAVEGAVWRGFSFTDMLLPCGILIAIGAVLFWIGVAIFRRIDG